MSGVKERSTDSVNSNRSCYNYILSSPTHNNNKKYTVCSKAFEKCYGISKYRRKKLIDEVKKGVINSELDLSDWRRVHDKTIESINLSLKGQGFGGSLSRDIMAGMTCASSEKTMIVNFSCLLVVEIIILI